MSISYPVPLARLQDVTAAGQEIVIFKLECLYASKKQDRCLFVSCRGVERWISEFFDKTRVNILQSVHLATKTTGCWFQVLIYCTDTRVV